ncbi:MAG: hypothetical protein MJZ41_12355 [Bacteroidaceae bacterium]|nr:hypothetical protein [Bacteroidaceae bacterium]
MNLLVELLIAVLLSVFDASLSTFVGLLIIIVLGNISVLLCGKDNRNNASRLFLGIFSIYSVIAYIYSLSFGPSEWYLVSDSMRYIESYAPRTILMFDKTDFYKCYFEFADSNALYNASLNLWAMLGNTIDDATVYFMTLFQTLFGCLSGIVLYRILSKNLEDLDAVKHAFIFMTCSHFLFYSGVIIRDIVIVYFYLRAFEIILNKFSTTKLLEMIAMMVIVWGVRLYSGLYYGGLVAFYIFINTYKTRLKFVTIPLFAIAMIFVLCSLLGSAISEQTMDELSGYVDMTMESEASKGGLILTLYKLPAGLSQIAIMLYAQMAPFPSYVVMKDVANFSNLVMSLTVMVYELFWFLTFYGFVLTIFSKKGLRFLSFDEKMLLLVAIAFILVNTAHPDIRRMMPVYPIIYYLSIKVKQLMNDSLWEKTSRQRLLFVWAGLMAVYLAIKGF